MDLKRVVPGPALRPYINCFWYARLEATAADTRFEVLPSMFANGFITLSGRYTLTLGDQQADCRPGHLLLAGPRTKLWSVTAPQPSETVGIHFKPGGLFPFWAPPSRNTPTTW